FIAPILVGPRARIEAAGPDIGDHRIVDVPHSHAAAARAVELVHQGEAGALMKGALHTDEMLAEVIARDTGIRTERRISHVFVMRTPAYAKPLLITDAAINVMPDLLAKRDIVQNAIDMARAIGIDVPKVAILSATEEVNPRLPSTIDAAALCKMADREQIAGGLLDGPLAFDIAVSPDAVAAKKLTSGVAGAADILVVPDLVAGNMLAKQLDYLGGADAFGIALGAQVPIILTSRADGVEERKISAALAKLVAERARL
ncbi:MAG: bifunctional enoyl-CoA hydratase/phosphate acetyltransferase, partial [Parasphingopyxis sp.]|uniref:bifunctional enoyl-CoA hydratase/phosphate acetyltransferase n=1 Tax=Parasphingopyxis sp. TaxID=1920299 RepID=UPI003F9FA400